MMAAAREKGKSLATLSCFYFYSVKNISKLLQWFLFWPMGYLQMFRFQIYEVFSRHLSVIFSKFNSSVVRGYSLYQLNSFTFIETCLKAHLMIYLGQLFRYIWKKILGRMLVVIHVFYIHIDVLLIIYWGILKSVIVAIIVDWSIFL